MHLFQRTALIIAALAATSLAWGQQQESADSAKNKSIVGTWQVLRHGVDCSTGERKGPDFQVLMTFNQCGTLEAFGVPPGSKPQETSPEYGVWSHEAGTQIFTFRDVSYGYDDDGNFTGRGEITATITLGPRGNTFTQQSVVDVYDADGNFLFSFCGAATGKRFK